MFNFVCSKLFPKIACESPAMDNYEVENLINDSYANRIRGFIAYSSIKPPVVVEIEFLCPVNIFYIMLNTTVGSQKCTGIEIFAKNSNDYTSIGKCIYDNTGIVFCNRRKYSKNNIPPNCNTSYHLTFFKSDTFTYFLNASAIKIVIFRTAKSVPCLGSVEVWGEPSRSCSAVTRKTINHIMQKATHISVANVSSSNNSEEFKIPEDFKDDLTYEIMTVPMTLPSGKTVDQTTLDKHTNSEILFGRKPCDPFTGVKFSATLKPVLNVALKSRIDMFLLQNSHREDLANVKRTLGGRTPNVYNSSSSSKKRKLEVRDELDELILKAKESPTFISFTNVDDQEHMCSNCHTQNKPMYEIPCLHRFCRSCLFKICESLKCSSCDTTFLKGDVKKCNL